jgi:hypothetical protein
MSQDEMDEVQILQENEQFLFDFIETLAKQLQTDPRKWQSFINLTSPLMGKTLEMIVAQGRDPRIPA